MPSHSIVQSVLLRRSAFKTLDDAKDWLTEHGYKYVLPDVTPTYFRFRQRDPKPLELTHRLRTTQLGDPEKFSPMGSIGALIIAYPKNSRPMAKDPPAEPAKSDRTLVSEAFDEMIASAGKYSEWSEPAAKEAKTGKMKVKRDEVKYVVDAGEDYEYKRAKVMIVTYRLPEPVKKSDVIVNRNDPRPPFPEISVGGKKLEVVVIDKGYLYLKGELEEAKRVWASRTKL